MNKISEDEIIKIIEELKDGVERYGFDYTVEEAVVINKNEYNAIQGLLDLYNKEKEENKELSEELTERICKNVEAEVFEEMRLELKQEKEKNKKLQIRCKELIEEKQELNTALLYDNINKDKIKDMQRYREFELQQEYKDFENDSEWKTYNKILEED